MPGVDAVEPGGFYRAVDAGGAVTALVGAREQPVLAPDGNTAQQALGGIVVDLEAAVVGIAGQRRPAGARIADGDREVEAAGQLWSGRVEPPTERIEQRSGPGLARVSSLVRWPATHVLFDGIEAGDMVQRLTGRGGAGCGMDVEEPAPDVCLAGHLADAISIEAVEPGIAIGVQIALGPGKMPGGAFALAVGRVAEQHGGRSFAAGPALVAHIGP